MSEAVKAGGTAPRRAVVPKCFLPLYAPGFIPRNEGATGTPIEKFADAEFCSTQHPGLLTRVEQSLISRLQRAVESPRLGPPCVLASAATCAAARHRAKGKVARILDRLAQSHGNVPLELNHLVEIRRSMALGAHKLIEFGHFLDSAEVDAAASPATHSPEPLDDSLVARLRALAETPAGERVTPQEIRFGQLFALAFPEEVNLRAALEYGSDVRSADISSAVELADKLELCASLKVAEEIEAVGAVLARGRRNSTRDSAWFAQRYGIRGYDKSILAAIGAESGVTRERVRQVVDRLTAQLQGRTAYLPVTMKALQLFESLLPKPEPEINASMGTFLGADLQVASLLEFASDIGALPVRANLSFVRARDEVRVAAPRHTYSWAKECGSIAGKMISSTGAAQLHWLTGILAQRGHRVTPSEVVGVIAARLGFEWLDEQGGWFWFGPEETENRVINVATKMLAVATRPVDLDELYSGLSRRRDRKQPSLPGELYIPPETCQRILERTPNFLVSQTNNFRLDKPVPVQGVLSETEYRVYQLMRERLGLAARHELHNIMVKKEGVNFVTFSVVIDRSPIVRNVDYGVFGLVGWRIEPAAFSRAWQQVGGLGANGRKPVAAPDADGWFCVEAELTNGSFNNRQVTVPSALARAVADGDYVLPADFGNRVIKKRQDRLSGVVREAITAEWPVGTKIAIALHPAKFEARVSRGELDLIRENSDKPNTWMS